ncbi:MAG: hypothetical protein QWI36_02975 [Wolbachia endosymbiont of Tyrophagus putrescentiae]|nr:hypothetical protein [Wolbachia endosymbiont of Tyrophagus putrescentiae]
MNNNDNNNKNPGYAGNGCYDNLGYKSSELQDSYAYRVSPESFKETSSSCMDNITLHNQYDQAKRK